MSTTVPDPSARASASPKSASPAMPSHPPQFVSSTTPPPLATTANHPLTPTDTNPPAARSAAPATPARDLDFRGALLAMLGISLVMLLGALDETIIGNILPSVVAELKDFDLYAWVATSYLLASMVSIPIFGRLGDYFGRKPFVIASTLVFTLSSLACAVAPSMLLLVIFRGFQGIGGGMVIGSAFACIPELFPDTKRRLRWQVVLSIVASVANAAGPSLGGFLTAHYSWRVAFYLNLPLGLIALLFAWFYLPYRAPAKRERKLRPDWLGAILVSLVLISLQMLVDWLPKKSAWCFVLAAVFVVTLVWLYRWEKRAPDALLPPRLFSTPVLRKLYFMGVLSGAVMYSMLIYLPLYFQGVYDFSPKDAGILITPLALLVTIGSIINGRIITRIRNPNWVLGFGLCMQVVASVGYAVVGSHGSFDMLMFLTVCAGLGFGFTMMNLTLFTQTMAEHNIMGIATAMQKSLRLVGGLLLTALMGTLTNWLYGLEIHRRFAAMGMAALASHYQDPQVLISSATSDATAANVAPAVLTAARASLMHAMSTGFIVVAVVSVISLGILFSVERINLHQQRTV